MQAESSLQREFDRLYEREIKPFADNIEEYRIKEKRKHDLLVGIFGTMIVLSLLVILCAKGNTYFSEYFLYYSIGFFVFSLIVLLIFPEKISKKYRNIVKGEILIPIIKLFGNLELIKKDELSLDAIHNFGLYPKARSKEDDDVIGGIYNNIPIVLTETQLSHKVSSGKSSKTITDFSGLIIKTEINKSINGILVGNIRGNFNIAGNIQQILGGAATNIPANAQSLVRMAEYMATKFGEYNSDLSNIFHLKNDNLVVKIPSVSKIGINTLTLEKVSFDYANLEQNLIAYSDNNDEAKSLLTSYLIPKINKLEKDFLFAEVSFVVINSEIYLFIANAVVKNNMSKLSINGFFEVGDLKTSMLDKNLYFNVFKELSKILSFINSFRTDEDMDE